MFLFKRLATVHEIEPTPRTDLLVIDSRLNFSQRLEKVCKVFRALRSFSEG